MNHIFGFTFAVTDNGEKTGDCFITPEFNTNQCIFYPVKEEEREVLLGTGQTNRGSLTPEGSSDAHQTEHQTVDGAFCEFVLFQSCLLLLRVL